MGVFFGDRIRDARKAAQFTQCQLAERLGVSNTSISNWEKGFSRPDADMIQKLCHVLRLEPNYFYGAENAPASERKRTVSDEEIKFALFGGDGEITDAMYDEVKRFAAFLKAREAGKKE